MGIPDLGSVVRGVGVDTVRDDAGVIRDAPALVPSQRIGFATSGWRKHLGMREPGAAKRIDRTDLASSVAAILVMALVAFATTAFGTRFSGIMGHVLAVGCVVGLITLYGYAKRVQRNRRMLAEGGAHQTRARLRDPVDAEALRVALTEGRCPCCDYELGGLQPDDEGLTRCVECGAAWRLDVWRADAPAWREPETKGGSWLSGRVRMVEARGRITTYLAGCSPSERHERTRGYRYRPGIVTLIVFGFLGLIGIGVTVYSFGAMAADSLGFAVAGVIVLWLVILIPTVAVLRDDVVRKKREAAVRDMLASGLCPCCESGLRKERSPIDGCMLCDACGAAWDEKKPRWAGAGMMH